MTFVKNFLVALVALVTLAAFVLTAGLGPIFTIIWLGIPPFPFGLPSIVVGWCIVGAFVYAMSEAEKKDSNA